MAWVPICPEDALVSWAFDVTVFEQTSATHLSHLPQISIEVSVQWAYANCTSITLKVTPYTQAHNDIWLLL
jgi:hypothetical protein